MSSLASLLPDIQRSAERGPDVDGTEVNVLDASYIGQPYHGEVCLHFATVSNNLTLTFTRTLTLTLTVTLAHPNPNPNANPNPGLPALRHRA